jgi:acyl carrier protein
VTPNGKLNRKALPEPEREFMTEKVVPVNDLEKTLLGIWAVVLKTPEEFISTDKSFFELGGHSIKAIHLLNKIGEALSLNLEIRRIFEYPTISKLANYIQSLSGKPEAITSAAIADYYPASSAQSRMYFQQMVNPESLAFNISGALELERKLPADLLKSVLNKLIERHETLRTSFMLSEEDVLQKINENVEINFEELHIGIGSISDTYLSFVQPFDLTSESLFRACLCHRDGAADVLLLDVHHIVSDGISYNILINDFVKLLTDQPLDTSSLRYVDFAVWEREAGRTLEEQKNYWQQVLSGDLPFLELPVMQNREEVTISEADSEVLILQDERYFKLNSIIKKAEVSGFMFLLSIYYILLSKLTGNNDLIIGTDVAGRSLTSLQKVVGSFVNILPLRVQIEEEEPFMDFLKKVKKCVSLGFQNQEFQFDQMVGLLDREIDMKANPIVQVHFAYVNLSEEEEKLREVGFNPIVIDSYLTTQYEFKIEAVEKNNTIEIHLIYSPALYDVSFIQVIKDYYYNILRGVLTNPYTLISEIALEETMADA